MDSVRRARADVWCTPVTAAMSTLSPMLGLVDGAAREGRVLLSDAVMLMKMANGTAHTVCRICSVLLPCDPSYQLP